MQDRWGTIPAILVMIALSATSSIDAGVRAADAHGKDTDDPMPANRLAQETSPYLLQHRHNPVDWYPWGEEAFAAARAANRPIFLSVGYSTCYWCHVMERESFESDDVAALLNEHFICIKVDREERPDVDDIYMLATQIVMQRGGWPNSVSLEPTTLSPFFAGTYFPREQFMHLLRQVSTVWRENESALREQAHEIAMRIEQIATQRPDAVAINRSHVDGALRQLAAQYDDLHAGFGQPPSWAPKFPTPVNLDMILDLRDVNASIRQQALTTLDRMAMGGIYDQVGGGFHRYSTDRTWTVPHFEKMLYDNGQLASTYAMSYEQTNDAFHGQIVRETLDYVLREMTAPDGAFFSAQDAEVNAREGQNYLWTDDVLRDTLRAAGMPDGGIDLVARAYGTTGGTNFQDPHHRDEPPANVLVLTAHPTELADAAGLSIEAFNGVLARANAILLKERDARDQPGLDDKIIVGWNGLMIAGFADGGRVLDTPGYIDAAARAARWILEHMRSSYGGLYRTARDGRASIDAPLEDYALFAYGLLALHRATDDPLWLRHAIDIMDAAEARFRDHDAGGYFDARTERTDLLVRTKDLYDDAVPGANGIMFLNHVMLAARTGERRWVDRAVVMRDRYSAVIAAQPTACTTAVRAFDRLLALDVDLPSVESSGAESSSSSPVGIVASPAVVQRRADGTMWTTLVFTIDEPYHINAHDAGADDVIPLTITAPADTRVTIDVDYPAGTPLDGPIPDVTLLVHDTRLMVPMTITAPPGHAGELVLSVRYQVCDDQRCLLPESVEVPLRFLDASARDREDE